MRELCGAHAFTKPYFLDDVVAKMKNAIQSQAAKGPMTEAVSWIGPPHRVRLMA
jgi:hypothetical protein